MIDRLATQNATFFPYCRVIRIFFCVCEMSQGHSQTSKNDPDAKMTTNFGTAFFFFLKHTHNNQKAGDCHMMMMRSTVLLLLGFLVLSGNVLFCVSQKQQQQQQEQRVQPQQQPQQQQNLRKPKRKRPVIPDLPLNKVLNVGDARDNVTPLFWHVHKAGGTTVQDLASHCLDMVVASEVGVLKGHDQDNVRKQIRPTWRFVTGFFPLT